MNHTRTFAPIYARILEALTLRTQTELAAVLGVKQSSISDAKKRDCIPDAWLMSLLRTHGLSPLWLETGEGDRYFRAGPDAPARPNLADVPARELLGELGRRVSVACEEFVAALSKQQQTVEVTQ